MMEIQPYLAASFDDCCVLFQSNIPEYFAASELAEYQRYLMDYATGSCWIVKEAWIAWIWCSILVQMPPSANACCRSFAMI
jgi:hypothetical protein